MAADALLTLLKAIFRKPFIHLYNVIAIVVNRIDTNVCTVITSTA